MRKKTLTRSLKRNYNSRILSWVSKESILIRSNKKRRFWKIRSSILRASCLSLRKSLPLLLRQETNLNSNLTTFRNLTVPFSSKVAFLVDFQWDPEANSLERTSVTLTFFALRSAFLKRSLSAVSVTRTTKRSFYHACTCSAMNAWPRTLNLANVSVLLTG